MFRSSVLSFQIKFRLLLRVFREQLVWLFVKFLCLLWQQTGKPFCFQLAQVWRRSLGGAGGVSVNSTGYPDFEQPIKSRKTLSTVLVYTKSNYRWLHLSVYTWRKNMFLLGENQTCFVTKMLKFGDGVRRMFTCKVGSCLSTWFVFDQQSIHRKRLRRIHGIVKLQRIIIKIKCAVSEREKLPKIEKNKRWEERADQKFKQLNLWRDSLLQRLPNFKCLAAKHVMSGTLLEHVLLAYVHA